ncbi:type VII secretion protein EssC [Paenibacillaceae bacterium WGS1546]|uniref:type VII secretion protein EssC n=1 Tax=Cohnella sp. WGS1546 TaxID=3366810 RepID=UPI00372D26BA
MQLSLLKDNELFTCVLPEKKKGQYWISHVNEQGLEEQLIGVEGIDGEWVLKSNRNAFVQGADNRRIKEAKLDAPGFYGIFLKKTHQAAWLYAEPVTEDRKTFRKLTLPVQGKYTVGRAEACDIRYANPHVSSKHAELIVTRSEVSIRDLDSANGTFVNGKRIRTRVLYPGDVVYIIGLKLVFGQGIVGMNDPDGLVSYDRTALTPYRKQEATRNEDEEEADEDNAVGYSFYRSPRFKRDIERAEFKIDPPPARADPQQTPLMLMLGPSMTMGMSAAFMGIFTLQNALSSGGSVRNALPTLVMSSSMLIGTILWPILTRRHEKKKAKRREKQRQEKYVAYLHEVGREIENESERQSRILHENHVTIDDCVSRIRLRQRNLWERTSSQNDFLKVRLGIGALPLDAEVKFPEKRFTLDDDNLQDELYKLAEKPKVLEQVPITLSLTEDWFCGLIGNRSSVADLVKGIVWQLTALHSYDELKLVFLYDNSERETWEFVRWLPHAWNREQGIRFLATNPNEAKELSAYLEKELAKREGLDGEELKHTSPYYLIFAINKSLAAKADVFHSLYGRKENIGVSVVHLYDELKHLPKECSMVVEFGGQASKIYDKDDISGQHILFQPDFYLKQDEHELAVNLANTHLESAASAYILPTMLTFLEMFGVGKIEHLNALQRWKENDPTQSLETPIGVDPTGELFKLDLHEKYHGPHGLIAGMTGSGKSEFIMTFILSLAVNYHPHEVAFILIDYKGGGMANAFERLPHLAGTITNLDGAAVKRSLISIQSELKRRQSIFSETGKQVGISNIDIYKYQKLYREGRVKEPLQHLYMISDEFAELKTQQPEFMEQLVSAARIGRSLGVHLILATQKPSGVVDDQIWSNSKFRICLKVQEKADSMDVIKRPDAAELSVTGRYYVQVGFNELFDLGQSAWAGAPYYPADRLEKRKDDSVAVIDNLGRVAKQVGIDKRKAATANPPKQIDEINKYLAAIAAEERIRIKPLWLDPIPPLIVLDELKTKYRTPDAATLALEPVIGEVDDPANQRQFAMTFPLTREGNAIVYGSAGNGKTTFLTTLIYSFIDAYTPSEVQFYLLDFGSETLRAFARAPHVGDVLLSHEAEKINNLFKMLYREVEQRKKLFADYGGDYQSYLKASGDSLPSLVVAIHNYAAFAETYDDKEEAISYLTREGLKYGIYFVLTAANTGAVRYRILQNFKQIYVLQLNDPTDYSGVLGNVDGIYPSKFKGRGIYKTDRVYEFQIAHVHRDTDRIFEYVRQACMEHAQRWTQAAAPKIPILPERIDLDYLADELQYGRQQGVPIGVEKHSLALAYYSFEQAVVHLVLSQSNDKADFLQGVAEVLAARPGANVLVLDPHEQFRNQANRKYALETSGLEERVNEWFRTLVSRNNSYKDAQERGEAPPEFDELVCVVHSLSGLMSRLSEDAQDKLKVMLEKAEAAYRVSFIVSEAVGNLSTMAYDSWFKAKVSLSDGIWLGNGIADQYQLKIGKLTNDLYQEIGDEFGYRLTKGKPTLIKLLTSVTTEPEAISVG